MKIRCFKSSFLNVFFVFKTIFEIDKWFPVIALIKIFIDFFTPFIMIYFPKLIIDSISNNNLNKSLIYIITLGIVSIIFAILRININSIIKLKSINIDSKFESHICNKMMTMKYENLENKNILNKFQYAINSLPNTGVSDIINTVIDVLTNISVFIGTSYIVFFLGFKITIIILLSIILTTWKHHKRSKSRYAFEKENVHILRKAAYDEKVMSDYSYAKEIRLFNMSNFIIDKYSKKLDEYNSMWWKSVKKRMHDYVVCFSLEAIRDFIIYYVITYKLLIGSITTGDFFMYIAATLSLSKAVNAIFIKLVDMDLKMKYISDIRYFFDNYDDSNIITKSKKSVLNNEKYEIEFKNVYFKYPNAVDYALKNINICIKSGEKLSIVGENGAGKSTFVKILMGFYKPTKGNVYLNGIDIYEIDYNEYLKIFSTVFQDYLVFPFSIKENIVLNNKLDKGKLNNVLDKLNFNKSIEKYIDKEDTNVSKIFDENGIELSGGEQQKLIISRALYKECKVYVFDEPTSALSPIAEYELLTNFNDIVLDKTVIYISHRMACCKFSDNIAVFKNGEIIEHGSHNALINNKNLYHSMFIKQFDGFNVDEDCYT